MTGSEYQKCAMRTANTIDRDKLLLNGVLGLNGESGEVADHLKKHLFQGHDLDKTHIAYEIGDCLWYIAVIAESIGMTLDEVMDMNIHKLMLRYPDGFSAERSRNRGA